MLLNYLHLFDSMVGLGYDPSIARKVSFGRDERSQEAGSSQGKEGVEDEESEFRQRR